MVDKLLGTKLGKYELRRTLGRGGMASVYEGYDALLNRRVAIKVLSPALSDNSDAVERFRREAVTAANLEHPNIIPIFDVKEENGIHYIAMRYIEGDTLAAVIHHEAPVSFPRAIELLEPIARALDYAHERGVVHRDIKPANILIDEEGRPTLTDFGIAKAADQAALTNTGEIMGTANYVSPEQLAGQPLNYRSDLYALAVTLYELLSAHLPFEGSSAQDVLYAHLYRAPVPLRTYRPDLPPSIEAVMARALAKDPQHRFTNGQELIDTLKHAYTPVSRPVSLPNPTPPPPPDPAPITVTHRPSQPPQSTPHPPFRPVTDQGRATPPPFRPVTDQGRATPPPHRYQPQNNAKPSRASLFKLAGILLAITLVLGLVLGAVLFFSRTPADTVNGSTATPSASLGYTGPRHENNGADLYAYPVKSTPAIDGNLGKWSNLPSIPVANNIPRQKQWGGTKDSSAGCYFGYDAQNFYVACLVVDDKHVQEQTGNLIWQGDDVELWFDTELANHLTTTYNSNLSPVPNVYQIGLSAGNWSTHKPEAYRWTTTLATGADLGIKVAAQPQGEGYNIEAAIPWSALDGFKPTAGKPIGFAVVLSDDDTPGLTGGAAQEKIVSTSPNWYWDSPKDFGNLFFE